MSDQTTELDARIERVRRYQSESQHNDDAMDYGEDRYITDLQLLAFAYAAELDATPVDEAWMMENCVDFTQLSIKRLGFHLFFFAGVGAVKWFPPCGDLPAIIRIGNSVRDLPPTRGLVRTLQRIGGGT